MAHKTQSASAHHSNASPPPPLLLFSAQPHLPLYSPLPFPLCFYFTQPSARMLLSLIVHQANPLAKFKRQLKCVSSSEKAPSFRRLTVQTWQSRPVQFGLCLLTWQLASTSLALTWPFFNITWGVKEKIPDARPPPTEFHSICLGWNPAWFKSSPRPCWCAALAEGQTPHQTF
jgi:hypothetical protein